MSLVQYGWADSRLGPQDPLMKFDRVTEPGGRYLQITWDSANSHIIQVDAYDGVNTQPIQSVTYTWTTFPMTNWPSVQVLSSVHYSDGTSANYTYKEESFPGAPVCSYPFISEPSYAAILSTADDARYAGPMRRIAYVYDEAGNRTTILTANYLSPHSQVAPALSTIAC